MAYVRPNPPLEMNPDRKAMQNAVVWVLGTNGGSYNSLGRVALAMQKQGPGTITEGADYSSIPPGDIGTRLYINAESSHNNGVFTRMIVFDVPATMSGNFPLYLSSDADNGGGYSKGSLEVGVTGGKGVYFNRSNEASLHVAPDNSLVTGRNTLVFTRLADNSMRYSINGGPVASVPASNFQFGRAAFGRSNNSAGGVPAVAVNIVQYAQDPSVTEDAYLMSLSQYPGQLVRQVGTVAEPVPGIAATGITIQGVAPLWQVGKAGPALKFALNGDPPAGDTVITPTAPNVTFNPATVTINAANPTATTVPTATAVGTTTVTIANNKGLNNPTPFQVELANDVSRTVTTHAEFVSAAAWAKSLDPVNLQQNIYIRIAADFTPTGVTLEAQNSNNDYHIIVEPNAGQDHSTLEGTGAYNYGGQGRQLTLASGSALVIKSGVEIRKMRLNITADDGLLVAPGGNGIRPRLDESKVMCNSNRSISINAYQVFEATDSLFVRSFAGTGPLVSGAWSFNAVGCTFALLPGGTASYAHTGGWGSGNGATMASNIYVNFNDPVDGDYYSTNNYATAGSNAGVTVGNPVVVNSASDFRPAGVALGAGLAGLKSTKDGRGKNRGLTPDAGAVQANPSADLAELTLTNQTFNNTTGELTLSGTFLNAMDSGFMQVDPVYNSQGRKRQGPYPLVINQANKTWTVTATIQRGNWKRPEVRGVNAGGIGPMLNGTTAITNYEELVAAVTPNMTTIPPNRHQPAPATSGTKKVEHIRNGTVIATYSEIGDLFSKDARYGTPTVAIQAGDEVRVWPAVYRKAVYFGGFAGATIENVKVYGVTVDGIRPAVRWQPNPNGGYGYDGGYGSGNGILYVENNKNCTWENIDMLWDGGYLAKALIYVYNTKGGTVSFKNMRIMGAWRQGENGVLSAAGTACGLLFENVESGFNGGDGGGPPAGGGASLAHGYYITRHHPDPETGIYNPVIWRGCFFHNAWRGHLLKVRNKNVIVEGCYFAGTPPSTLNDTPYGNSIGPFAYAQNNISHASNFDMPNGGSLRMVGNIFTKNYTGYDQGRAMFNFAAESDINDVGQGGQTTDPSGKVEIFNNTFVAYTDVSTSYSSGTRATVDPTGWWWGVGGNPNDASFKLNVIDITVRDNVYAGIPSSTWMEPDQYSQKLTLDEINLPGRDNAVPFSPKTPKPASRQNVVAGTPMYVHRAFWGARTDNNMGAVGVLQTAVVPTGHAKQQMWTPTRNTDQAGYTALGLNNAYPQQVEWTDAAAGATVPATRITLAGPSSVVKGQSIKLLVSTDQLLTGSQTVTITLYDNASGTFVPATFDRTAANDQATEVTYTPATSGNKTVEAWRTAGLQLTEATKVVAVSEPATVDATPPQVTIQSTPSSVTAAGNVTLSASATDNVGVTRVEFFRGNTLLGEVTTLPYQYVVPLTRADNGTVVFKAKAYDAAGNSTEATVSVVVNVPAAAPRALALPLTTDGVTPVPDTTGLRYAFFDQTVPDAFTAPVVKGTNGTITGGVFNLSLPESQLPAGGVGCLLLTNSNGSPTQSPPALVFYGPVTVN